MSVSRGASSGYDDLEQMVVQRGYNTANGDSTEGDVWEISQSYDILGGLQRGEKAELVMLRYNIQLPPGKNTSDIGLAESKFELGTHPEPLFEESKVSIEEEQEENDGNGVFQIKDREDTLMENDLLLQLHGEYTFSFKDGGGGGGGSTWADWTDTIHFRDEAGTGPVFDRHDHIYEHVQMELADDASQSMNVWLQFFFDVTED